MLTASGKILLPHTITSSCYLKILVVLLLVVDAGCPEVPVALGLKEQLREQCLAKNIGTAKKCAWTNLNSGYGGACGLSKEYAAELRYCNELMYRHEEHFTCSMELERKYGQANCY